MYNYLLYYALLECILFSKSLSWGGNCLLIRNLYDWHTKVSGTAVLNHFIKINFIICLGSEKREINFFSCQISNWKHIWHCRNLAGNTYMFFADIFCAMVTMPHVFELKCRLIQKQTEPTIQSFCADNVSLYLVRTLGMVGKSKIQISFTYLS